MLAKFRITLALLALVFHADALHAAPGSSAGQSIGPTGAGAQPGAFQYILGAAGSAGYASTTQFGTFKIFGAPSAGTPLVYCQAGILAASSGTCPVAPSAPQSFAAGTTTSSTIPLTWSAPATGNPASYTYAASYALHGTGSYMVAASGISGLSYTITGLTASTAYDVQITATNSYATGSAATLSNVSTSGVTTVVNSPSIPSGPSFDWTMGGLVNASSSPSGSTTPGFTIYRTGSGTGSTFTTNYNPVSMQPSCTYTYYVNPTSNATGAWAAGNDGHAGTSPATARQNISTTLGLQTTGTVCIVLYDLSTPTVYQGTTRGWGSATPTTSVVLTTYSGNQVYFVGSTSAGTPTWTNSSGACYETALTMSSSNWNAAIDLAHIDQYGMGQEETQVTSAAACAANPGSFFADTTNGILYVQASDSRSLIGDTLMVPPSTANNVRLNPATDLAGSTVWMQNISIISGTMNFNVNHAQTSQIKIVMDKIVVQGNPAGDGFTVQGPFDNYVSNSFCGDTLYDCYSIHSDPANLYGHGRQVLINDSVPPGHQNGHSQNGNQNCDTLHDNNVGIAVNLVCSGSQGTVIGNNATNGQNQQWILGGSIGPSLATGASGTAATVGVSAGSATGQNSYIWLDTTTISATPAGSANYTCYSGSSGSAVATIYLANTSCPTTGASNSGTILTYTP